MSKVLVGKWKLHPTLLRILQPEGFSYLLSHSSTKQERMDNVQLSQGQSKF